MTLAKRRQKIRIYYAVIAPRANRRPSRHERGNDWLTVIAGHTCRLLFRLLIGLGLSWPVRAETDILILLSHDSPPYQQALDGFKAHLAEQHLQAEYRIQTLTGNAETETFAEQLRTHPASLILTLGTPATRIALAQPQKTPLVAGLVLDTDELRQHPNATAVGLNFPASLQWLWLRRLLPDAQQIAVIHAPQHSADLYQALEQQARAEGISLTQAAASSAEDLPALLQNLPPQLDAVWAVDGTVAYNAASVRELLLYSFRNRVPLIGLSAQWVKAGALYALDWDYTDLGTQAAELANSILQKNSSPEALAPLFPRKVQLVLNSTTAEHMKLKIADRWLSEMTEVFR